MEHKIFFKGDKGNTIRESYIHHFDASKKNVVVWEITITFLTNENVTSRLPGTSFIYLFI